VLVESEHLVKNISGAGQARSAFVLLRNSSVETEGRSGSDQTAADGMTWQAQKRQCEK